MTHVHLDLKHVLLRAHRLRRDLASALETPEKLGAFPRGMNVSSTCPAASPASFKENSTVYRLAIVSLVIALIAAFVFFAGVLSLSWGRPAFFIFLGLAVFFFLGGVYKSRYS
jgi:hypothetical protein